MKTLYWQMSVAIVVILLLASFTIVFQSNITAPKLAGIPFIFWTSFLLTVLLVLMTYLGFRVFPYKEDK